MILLESFSFQGEASLCYYFLLMNKSLPLVSSSQFWDSSPAWHSKSAKAVTLLWLARSFCFAYFVLSIQGPLPASFYKGSKADARIVPPRHPNCCSTQQKRRM